MAESITHNADTDTGNFEGITIKELRKRYETDFNIKPDAIAFVNGTQAEDDYVVKPGDKVEFKESHTDAA